MEVTANQILEQIEKDRKEYEALIDKARQVPEEIIRDIGVNVNARKIKQLVAMKEYIEATIDLIESGES